MTTKQYSNLKNIYTKTPDKSNLFMFIDKLNLDEKTSEKIKKIKKNFQICDKNEECLFFYNNTALTNSTENFLVTDKNLYYKEVINHGNVIPIHDIKSFEKVEDNRIRFNGYEMIILFSLEKNTEIFVEIVNELIAHKETAIA